VRKPTKLCTAANKNDEGFLYSTARLLCYKIRSTPKFQQSTPIFVNDQFGPDILDKVTHADELCVPTITLGQQ
jgi:hypothetical protein